MPYNAHNNKVPMLKFPLKLDMGAGLYPKKGYTRLDFAYEADICWDLTKGIPLPDSSVADLYTSHTLEHFNAQEFDDVLREMVRVCQNETLITISVPHAETPEAKLPGHYMSFDEGTMQAINQWLPHTEPTHLELQSVDRDGYSIIGIFKVIK